MSWSGRRVTEARTIVAQWLPAPCGQCGQEVTIDQDWVVGHIKSRSMHPELTWVVSNWRPEHRPCSDKTGQQAVIDKARREGASAALANAQSPYAHGKSTNDHQNPESSENRGNPQNPGKSGSSVFPGGIGTGQPPPLPISLPGGHLKPQEIRPDLEWANATRGAPTWLLPVLAVPQDAGVPLAMTPVHPEAVWSYGLDAVIWIESQFGVRLRWWQVLTVVRMLEHRLDGSLCWRTILLSASRRSGKSLLLRSLACWRLAHAHLFGEIQTVVHFGSDTAITREVQRGAWRWAEEVADWKVSRANGKEAVETDNGDRWLTRAKDAVYGYDICLGLGDEVWDVPDSTVTDGVEPAMLERSSPQLLLTSTAHRRARPTMRKRISAALAQDDGETLLLLWAARPQDDPADPSTWRAASPHWSTDRHRTLAAKYQAALEGQADAELDDANPLEGFASQYLNRWQLNARAEPKGDPLVTPEEWAALAELPEDRAPDTAAIESWFAEGVSLALGWRTEGPAMVRVSDHPDLASAVEALKASSFRGTTIVGASLATDPALAGVRVSSTQTRTTAAVGDLSRLLSEGGIRHDAGAHLSEQILAVRTAPGPDGPRLLSRGRADALKAATWAALAARKRGVGKGRILLPSSVRTAV